MKYKTLKMKPEREESNIIRIDPKRLIDIAKDFGFPRIAKGHNLEPLNGGRLGGHAIYLTDDLDWVLGRDTTDKICLVPLRKEEDLGEER